MTELDAQLAQLWTALDNPSTNIGGRGWAERCCGEQLAAIPPLVETIKDCVAALERGFVWVPCSIPIEISDHIQAVTDAVDRFASADNKTEAGDHLADASSSLARADALMNELMLIHLRQASISLRGRPVSGNDRLDAQSLVRAIRDADNQIADLLLAVTDPLTDRTGPEWNAQIALALNSLERAQAVISATDPLIVVAACEVDPRIEPETTCPSLNALSNDLETIATDIRTSASAEDQDQARRVVTAASSRLISITDHMVEYILLVN
jgi:hypothetical protein